MENALHIAEIPYENGAVRQRYSRYLAVDQTHWVRHGLFVAYHPNGNTASKVTYEHGLEQGPSESFHANGQLASAGAYKKGKMQGFWQFFSSDGSLDEEANYINGEQTHA